MTSSNDQNSAAGFRPVRKHSRMGEHLRTYQPKHVPVGQLSARERLVMSLQLRGLKQTEIAQSLNLTPATVHHIQSRSAYAAELHRRLDEVDDEFLRLKPKALRAVDNGLESNDEVVGLRAAELWFKAHGYKGFGKGEAGPGPISAEDIASRLIEAGGGTVTIAVERSSACSQCGKYPCECDDYLAQGQETSPR